MPADSTMVTEIFSSIQGEGIFTGCRQIFIRFWGCNLNCRYCDTRTGKAPVHCRIETEPGTGNFCLLPNPLTAAEVALRAGELNPSGHQTISLTGGEPLLHTSFLSRLIPLLPPARQGIYLETNGTLPEELARIIDGIDIIAMDIKLPGTAGITPCWREHEAFLALALAKKKKVMVKIIIADYSADREIEQAVELLSRYKDIPVVLQPVSSSRGIPQLAPGRALAIQARALEKLIDVRVIPQTHKYLHLL
ncbi:7-carboxy-7-deazaguanine synthase QueE [Desulfotomaculum copahuensis]|uniref:7-carboxy-7-deazaguanine synthase n=1 Tax=Desulfotomaculum copahuensis TaxID=1838280 RepID=A0A1B7LE33_9FIRM|nr:7-carboxy-7-deazaguanine synthase QueE [Desulfotomaculum copahuensis]OAT81350.1 organic radical-activating protein [Desulfotomaculum copahuensis]